MTDRLWVLDAPVGHDRSDRLVQVGVTWRNASASETCSISPARPDTREPATADQPERGADHMLNIASKNPETAEDAPEVGTSRRGTNGRLGGAQSRTVSVLGGGLTVIGDVTGEGEFRIEGRVEGSVSTTGRVVVDSSGEVEGGIEAQEVVASGKISGKIAAKDAVRLKNGCQVEADVQAPVIELEEGGTVNGRLDMKG